MSEPMKRAYTGKDADMLTACATIAQNAINHKTELIAKRPTWADPFLPDVKLRIDNAFPNFLGADNAQQLRQATRLVNSIQASAMADLSLFKVQIEEDFRGNKPLLKEMLTTLGFVQHYASVQNKSQSALVELLFKFKTNMTASLQTQISAAGTPAELITGIIGYAETLNNSNIAQEALKGGRKEFTLEAITEFNEIYTQVISIAKIASRIFKDNPAIRDQFSYAKILRAVKGNAAGSNGGSVSTSNPGESGSGGTVSNGDNEIPPL
ncbi:MAG TPA: hypothetical protein VIN10_01480 [Bacteroidales bacterium]